MRDIRIDLLRFCGLAMIIFAHVGPPGVLFQLRNFDVPLMVLVSGMAFGLSYKSNERFIGYLWKRIKRLVFPVWIFLSIYFSLLVLLDPSSEDLKLRTIVTSYALLGGFGYVWIIRVFMLVAVVSPFIFKYSISERNDVRFLKNISLSIILFEIIRYFSLPFFDNTMFSLLASGTHYIIPYAIVFALGIRLPTMNEKITTQVAIALMATFLLICISLYLANGELIPTQKFKYPPSIYYLSYAISVSIILWKGIRYLELIIDGLKIKSIVLFIAQNSIWVYLWHIPLIKYIELNFILKYIITISIATIATYIQVTLIKGVLLNHIDSPVVSRNIKMMLTG